MSITLIDADSLCYSGTATDTLSEVLDKVDQKIKFIVEKTEADQYVLFVSKGRYFRHGLKDKTESQGSYKANRSYKKDFSKIIKEYLIKAYDAVSYSGAEADDAVVYFYKKWSKTDNVTLATIDKDLLQTIPGKHLNYNKKVGPEEWDMVWVETTRESAKEFFRSQLIIGDPSDGVKGIPKKGIKYWENTMMKDGIPELSDILNEYIAYYDTVGTAVYEFQKSYRMLHLLDCDEDWLREVGYVPEEPELIKVNNTEDVLPKFE